MKEYINEDNILATLNKLKYKTFADNLLIVAIRSTNQTAGKFDDYLYVRHIEKGVEKYNIFRCTTDPSDLYLKQPMSKLGCAILKPGQWEQCWTIGKHKTHTALVQLRKVTVIRDYNKNNILDYDTPTVFTSKAVDNSGFNSIQRWYNHSELIHVEETGIFGLDVHRASQYTTIDNIGLYSAGCVVIQNPLDFNAFMNIMQLYKEFLNNRFTVTLITEEQLRSNVVSASLSRSGSLGIASSDINKQTAPVDELSQFGIRKGL